MYDQIKGYTSLHLPSQNPFIFNGRIWAFFQSMVRVYLDWVVFNRLRKQKSDMGPYAKLLALIQNHSEKLILPYSHAHLNDLSRSRDGKSPDDGQLNADLEFLDEISGGHCFALSEIDKSVFPTIRNAKDYYSRHYRDSESEWLTFEEVFGSAGDDDLDKSLKLHFDSMTEIKSGFDFEELHNSSKRIDYSDYYPNTLKEDNFFNLFKDIFHIANSPKRLSRLYKVVRNDSIEQLKIDTNPSKWPNPINYLDEFLQKKNLANSLKEYIQGNLSKRLKGASPSRFETFLEYFITLDQFGFFRDKELKNLIDDAQHAFFGAHCDFFLTDDKNTFHKTNALYQEFNVSTSVCQTEDFLRRFYSRSFIDTKSSPKRLLDQIASILDNSVILRNSYDDELNPVTIHKIHIPLLDFFDRMQISHFANETILTFYQKRSNYSDFLFWTEIRMVVNKVTQDWGPDQNGRSEFIEEDESKEFETGGWKGRVWFFSDEMIGLLDHLDTPQDPLGLRLRIRRKNPSSPSKGRQP